MLARTTPGASDTSAVPHDNPTPNPQSNMLLRLAENNFALVHNVTGMEAELVLPQSSSDDGSLSAANPVFFAIVSLIILFAWCNTRKSTFSATIPAVAITRPILGGTREFAKPKMSAPRRINWSGRWEIPSRSVSNSAWPSPPGRLDAKPPRGMMIASLPEPSDIRSKNMGGTSTSSSNAVAEPASPNNGHALLSCSAQVRLDT